MGRLYLALPYKLTTVGDIVIFVLLALWAHFCICTESALGWPHFWKIVPSPTKFMGCAIPSYSRLLILNDNLFTGSVLQQKTKLALRWNAPHSLACTQRPMSFFLLME